jgi:hypothetical protein
MLQVWTGALCRTAPDWSLLVRGVANDSRRSTGFEVLEGIISTDRYGGHLFANINILVTGVPILLLRNRPLLQVQPLHRAHYSDRLLDDFTSGTFNDVPADRWQSYKEWVVALRHDRGHYAVIERKRRAAES